MGLLGHVLDGLGQNVNSIVGQHIENAGAVAESHVDEAKYVDFFPGQTSEKG